MDINYAFRIDKLECYPSYDTQSNVVFNVYWTYYGKNENNVSSSRNGVTSVVYETGSPFTPFNELTETQVLNWILPNITMEQQTEMKIAIENDIQWQINQTDTPVTPPLPWVIDKIN